MKLCEYVIVNGDVVDDAWLMFGSLIVVASPQVSPTLHPRIAQLVIGVSSKNDK